MIDEPTLTAIVRQALPDAVVRLEDRTGTMDHFNLFVRSSAFAGRNLLDQHRLVYAALAEPMRDGRIHALQITTEIAS
jgi:stress-induced morphogen